MYDKGHPISVQTDRESTLRSHQHPEQLPEETSAVEGIERTNSKTDRRA